MKSLADAGILVRDGEQRFKYAPKPASMTEAVEETAKMYNERRTAVINFIYAAPMRNISDSFSPKIEAED
ncbi:MAG TPA: hypothetical protein V6C81_27785 [Planktothrix sp.]|jgi:hypothetical protein